MEVSDIMTKDVVTVKKDTPLREAASNLAKLRIHGMPVVDDKNNVVGIITESDFFTKDSSNIYLPTFLDFIKSDPAEAEKMNGRPGLEQKTKVADIMTEKCVTVKTNLPVEHLIILFKEKNFNTLPVIDNNEILVGIVTIMDVIKLL